MQQPCNDISIIEVTKGVIRIVLSKLNNDLRRLPYNKKIAIFNHSEDFKKIIACYDKNIPIYIDSDLKEEIAGEMFEKFLYDHGFHNLYLATEYEKDRFGHFTWIKEIVSKKTPLKKKKLTTRS